jgi:hypothetical protein
VLLRHLGGPLSASHDGACRRWVQCAHQLEGGGEAWPQADSATPMRRLLVSAVCEVFVTQLVMDGQVSLTASAVHLFGGRIAHFTHISARSCENTLHLIRG